MGDLWEISIKPEVSSSEEETQVILLHTTGYPDTNIENTKNSHTNLRNDEPYHNDVPEYYPNTLGSKINNNSAVATEIAIVNEDMRVPETDVSEKIISDLHTISCNIKKEYLKGPTAPSPDERNDTLTNMESIPNKEEVHAVSCDITNDHLERIARASSDVRNDIPTNIDSFQTWEVPCVNTDNLPITNQKTAIDPKKSREPFGNHVRKILNNIAIKRERTEEHKTTHSILDVTNTKAIACQIVQGFIQKPIIQIGEVQEDTPTGSELIQEPDRIFANSETPSNVKDYAALYIQNILESSGDPNMIIRDLHTISCNIKEYLERTTAPNLDVRNDTATNIESIQNREEIRTKASNAMNECLGKSTTATSYVTNETPMNIESIQVREEGCVYADNLPITNQTTIIDSKRNRESLGNHSRKILSNIAIKRERTEERETTYSDLDVFNTKKIVCNIGQDYIEKPSIQIGNETAETPAEVNEYAAIYIQNILKSSEDPNMTNPSDTLIKAETFHACESAFPELIISNVESLNCSIKLEYVENANMQILKGAITPTDMEQTNSCPNPNITLSPTQEESLLTPSRKSRKEKNSGGKRITMRHLRSSKKSIFKAGPSTKKYNQANRKRGRPDRTYRYRVEKYNKNNSAPNEKRTTRNNPIKKGNKDFPRPLKTEIMIDTNSRKATNIATELPRPKDLKYEAVTINTRIPETYITRALQPRVRLKRLSLEPLTAVKKIPNSNIVTTFNSCQNRRNTRILSTSNEIEYFTDQEFVPPATATTESTANSSTCDDSGVSISSPYRRENATVLLEIAAERAFINNHLIQFGYSPIQFDLYNNFNDLRIFLKYLLGQHNTSRV